MELFCYVHSTVRAQQRWDTVGQSVYRCWCLAPRPTELLRKRKSVQSKCFFQTWGLSLASCGLKRKSSEASINKRRKKVDGFIQWMDHVLFCYGSILVACLSSICGGGCYGETVPASCSLYVHAPLLYYRLLVVTVSMLRLDVTVGYIIAVLVDNLGAFSWVDNVFLVRPKLFRCGLLEYDS